MFEDLINQIDDLLGFVTDDDIQSMRNETMQQLNQYFTSKEVIDALDLLLIEGDKQGYTIEKYTEEISQVGELFKKSMEPIYEKYSNSIAKLDYCRDIENAVSAFMITALNYITNRNSYNISIELCHPNAKVPMYAHDTDWGADIYAVEDQIIPPLSYGVMVPTGLKVIIPHGWMLSIRPRSGMSHKTPLRISNAPGTIDETYRGEIKILFDNFTSEPVTIKAGDRIAQMGLEKNNRVNYHIVEKVDTDTDRGEGGFGSSGN